MAVTPWATPAVALTKIPGCAYLPEVSDNYEFGAKTLLLDGRLRLNATAFTNKYQNQQLTVGRIVNGQPTADLINAQQATLTGIELDILGQLSETWRYRLPVVIWKGNTMSSRWMIMSSIRLPLRKALLLVI